MKYFILFILLIGCSSPAPKPLPLLFESTGELKVSVKSGGHEVASDGYLLRVRLSPAEARRLAEQSHALSGTEAVDNSGIRFGFRIAAAGPLRVLGLRAEDVVTALGKTVAPTAADFPSFFASLQRHDTSLTYDREGLPRKVLISVE
jgi:hypothetical protein